MIIEDVLSAMRAAYGDPDACCVDADTVYEWVRCIEAVMQEGDAWGRELVVRNRELTDAQDEIERLTKYNARLRGMADEFRALMVKVDQLDEKDVEIEKLYEIMRQDTADRNGYLDEIETLRGLLFDVLATEQISTLPMWLRGEIETALDGDK